MKSRSIQFSLLLRRLPLNPLFPVSQDTHLPKNTIKEEGWGQLAKSQKQRGGQKRGTGGSRRVKREEKEERNRLSTPAIVSM